MVANADVEATVSKRQRLERLLEAATVPIFVNGHGSGTGFFVAQGRLLTALHVVDATEAVITVLYDGRSYMATPVLETRSSGSTMDVAMLQAPDLPSHACVLLRTDIDVGDTFFSWGYPDIGREGESTVVRREGERLEGGARLIKLSEGQIRPGQSGAPLMNIRTGCVCALIRATRSSNAALGGSAVPIAHALECWPDLVAESARTHPLDSPWRQCLPASDVDNYLRTIQRVMHDSFSDLHEGLGHDLPAVWIPPVLAEPPAHESTEPNKGLSFSEAALSLEDFAEMDIADRLAFRDTIRCVGVGSEDARKVLGKTLVKTPRVFADALRSILSSVEPWVVIEGPAGAGKSALLTNIARYCFYEPARVGLDRPRLPIVIKAAALSNQDDGSLTDILGKALAEREQFVLEGFSSLTRVFDATDASWLLLVDGLDEAPGGLAGFLRLLPALKRRGCASIAVGRTLSGDIVDQLVGHLYSLEEWTETQTTAFSEQVLGTAASPLFLDSLRQCPGELASTPLFVAAASRAFKHSGPESLKTTAGVFQAYTRTLVDECRRQLEAQLLPLHGVSIEKVVSTVALASTDRSVRDPLAKSGDTLADWLRAQPRNDGHSPEHATAAIESVASTSTFFRIRGRTIEWRHLLIRDFITASAIAAAVPVETMNAALTAKASVAAHEAPDGRRVALFVIAMLCDRGQSGRTVVTELLKLMRLANNDFASVMAAEALAEGAAIETSVVASLLDELRVAALSLTDYGMCGRALALKEATGPGYRRLLAMKRLRSRASYSDYVKAIARELVKCVRNWRHSYHPSAVCDLLVLGCVDEAAALLHEPEVAIATRWDVAEELHLDGQPIPSATICMMVRQHAAVEPLGTQLPYILRDLTIDSTDFLGLLGDPALPSVFRMELLNRCKGARAHLKREDADNWDSDLRAAVRLSLQEPESISDSFLAEQWLAVADTPGGLKLKESLIYKARHLPGALAQFVVSANAPISARLDAAESLVPALYDSGSKGPVVDVSGSLDLLRKVAESDPAHGERAISICARLLEATGRHHEAVEMMEARYRLNPADLKALYEAASIAYSGNDGETVLRLTTDIPSSEWNLSLCLLRCKQLARWDRFSEAVQLWESQPPIPNVFWSDDLLFYGRALLMTGRLDAARAAASRVIDQERDNEDKGETRASAHILLADAAVIEHGAAAGRDAIDAARKAGEHSVRFSVRNSTLLLDTGEVHRARLEMQLAAKSPDADDLELEWQWANRQYDALESTTTRLREHNPQCEWYWYVLGAAQLAQGKKSNAETSLERSIAAGEPQYRSSARIASNRALALLALGERAEAEAVFEQLLSGNEVAQLLLHSDRELRKLARIEVLSSDVSAVAKAVNRRARKQLRALSRNWRPGLTWGQYQEQPQVTPQPRGFFDWFR